MQGVDKHAELQALVKKRRAEPYAGYKTIGDYHDGVYECDYVSPYTKSASKLDADVMILLQDWASDNFLSGPIDPDSRDWGRTRDRKTNTNLDGLLSEHLELNIHETYATNLFPFIKPGTMNNAIPFADVARAAEEFALPQIRIVSPRAVVCLGKATFDAVLRACGHRRSDKMAEAIETLSPYDFEGHDIWCQAHTGQLGQNNRHRAGPAQVSKDWRRMAKSLRRG